MWLSIISGIKELGAIWLKSKKAQAEAKAAMQQKLAQTEADWDNIAQQQAQYSWKDELITVIWFSPLVVAWFYPDRATQWVSWISELPYFYQIGIFGIMSASFGLRWWFKQQSFSITRKKVMSKSGGENE